MLLTKKTSRKAPKNLNNVQRLWGDKFKTFREWIMCNVLEIFNILLSLLICCFFSQVLISTQCWQKKSLRELCEKLCSKGNPCWNNGVPPLYLLRLFWAQYQFVLLRSPSSRVGATRVRPANWKCIYTMSVPEGRDTKDKHSWRAIRVGPRCARTLVRLESD